MPKTFPLALTLLACTALAAASPAPARADTPLAGLTGRALIALADGDMVASAYIDGQLGEKRPDLLHVIPLDGGARTQAALPLSNSVQVWPNVLDISRDGRFAVVSEPRAERPAGAAALRDIPPGRTLSLVDLTDPRAPRITAGIELEGPTAVSIHPGGRLVAVALLARGEVALVPIDEGRFGTPRIMALDLPGLADPTVRDIAWHPSGDFAAVTLPGAARVAFMRLAGTDAAPALERWGDAIQTAPLPGRGRWTEDGRHYLVTVTGLHGAVAQLAYGRSTSTLDVIRFDATDRPDSPPTRGNDGQAEPEIPGVSHVRVASVPTGQGYVENFAISPDGRWVVGLNMRASWLPAGAPGRTAGSSLTLLRFDAATGDLVPVGEATTDALLPQGVAFDASSRRLVTTAFAFDDPRRDGGALQFWAIEGEESPVLRRLDGDVAMPRGTHLVEIIR